MTPQKYIYTGGSSATFMGYFFWNRKPVTIRDRATLVAIQKRKDFEVYEEKTTETQAPKVLAKDECPKCGKIVKQGMFMHQKWCRG